MGSSEMCKSIGIEVNRMQNCKTTVVIPNYNGIKYIRACLDSLKNIQAECKFHTLVVDNGSKEAWR